MLVAPQYRLYGHRQARPTVNWSHPAASSLKAAYLFGTSQSNNMSSYIGELTGLVTPGCTQTIAGTATLGDSSAVAGRYVSASQTGSDSTNYTRIQTNVLCSGSFSFCCVAMRSISTGSVSTNTEMVQEICTTEVSGGGGKNGWEINLGNGFDTAANRDRLHVSINTGGGATNAWVDGVKYLSANTYTAASFALVNGTWYGISGTLASTPVGNAGLCFLNTVFSAGQPNYGLSGGLAFFALFSTILSDDIMAGLSVNPFSLLDYGDPLENSILQAAAASAAFRRTLSQLGTRTGSRQAA